MINGEDIEQPNTLVQDALVQDANQPGNGIVVPDYYPSQPSSLHLDQFHDAHDELEAVRSAEGSEMDPPSPTATTTAAALHNNNKELSQRQQKGGFIQRRCFRYYNRFAERSPRAFACCFGFLAPLLALVVLASLCGWPLALLESPLEIDQNDFILEHQMRLLVEASLYTNLTQALPRICLQLYVSNWSIDEFLLNVSTLLEGPPTEEDVTDYLSEQNLTDDANASSEVWDWLLEDDNGTGLLLNASSSLVMSSMSNYSLSNLTTMAQRTAATAAGTATTKTSPSTVNPEQIQETLQDRIEDFVDGLHEPFQDYYNYYNYVFQGHMMMDDNNNNTNSTNQTAVVNLTDLMDFVEECGAGLRPVIDKMFLSLTTTATQALTAPLTFAWTRCGVDRGIWPSRTPQEEVNLNITWFYASLLENALPPNALQDMLSSDSAAYDQSIFYREQWEQDRRRLYVKYLEEEQRDRPLKRIRNNQTDDLPPAIWNRIRAHNKAIQEASGGMDCLPNIPASCWFWFTLMTTIGYGNASPQSFGGKCMVFTLGFISMILFGMASTRAAYVITSIFDDGLVRIGLRFFTRPWIQCFLWGLFYYLWMALIAFVYAWWRKERLGEEDAVSYSTAYWFSYISITTVGFGDYFLQPEVIEISDCILFPIIFLLGFSVLASFLTKLSNLIQLPFRDGPSLTEQFRITDESRALRRSNTASKTGDAAERQAPH